MARFSDRLDSANRLIIAAAAIYAGCVTFAHADVYDDMMMAPEHHTAQALSKARALCGKNAARGGYAGDQFVVQALLRSSTDRGGRARQDFTEDERRLILLALHPDANASPERREAAFRAFNAKRGRRTQP